MAIFIDRSNFHRIKKVQWSLALLAMSATFIPGAGLAQMVGDSIVNPLTGASEEIIQIDGGSALTNNDNVILVNTDVGDTYVLDGDTYTVTAVTTDSSTPPRIISLTMSDGGTPPTIRMEPTAREFSDPSAGNPDTGGNAGGPVNIPIPAGNVNVVADSRVGSRGNNGRNGYGVEVCIIKCFTIGRSGRPGSAGGNGPTITRNITVGGNGNIQSVSNGLPGITVVSKGGDGGNGGDSYGALPPLNGGKAGLGGNVTVNSSVEISTSGVGSHGIFAQSRGGKGGNGGGGYILSSSGVGGPASAGRNVTVTNTGKIKTTNFGANGIFAQSIGGGGGSSGDSYGIVGNVNSGSVGGNGGTVRVTNSGGIETQGVFAHGIQAQSIGGTGGNAGNAGGIAAFGGNNSSAGGGSGGSVTVNNNAGGSILVSGTGSVGIFAQSVGGGGGNGGFAAGIASFGSKGGRGGNGGNVTVRTQAGSSIETRGVSGHGIHAQSIGGGGGSAGVSGGVAAIGGSGGKASNGGVVLVENRGQITTTNAQAKGVMAQSIGGGGGSASGTGGLVALGGGGGEGGNGGAVTVRNFGGIETKQAGGDAIYAQSIGGGGGSGSSSGGLVALGGKGTVGGTGAAVNVLNEGSLKTAGAKSRGILAQSIGGGGGAGGDGGGLVAIGGSGGVASNGGTVTVENKGQIDTDGNVSHGIQVQSIGGGGGDGGSTGGLVAVGGGGGGGGDGGLVTATNAGRITTAKNDSSGIFAQSVGGGGGNGGSAVAVGAFVSVAVGGKGGNGGKGGQTTINLNPRTVTIGGASQQIDPLIKTEGDRSNGIFAQSVGGGGGNGGFATSVAVGAFGAVSVAVGGSGGKGGDGGKVAINGNGAVTTEGLNSDGVLAQSVGGGGGNGGASISVAASAGLVFSGSLSVGVGGSGGDGGEGGDVTLRSGGSITTDGALSEGLIAQSVGGGGGNGGTSVSVAAAGSDTAALAVAVGVGGTGGKGGSAGKVDTVYNGNVTTKQSDSTGVLIQAVGGSGGNGGFNVSGSVAGAGTAAGAVSAGVGGSGGGAGNGGVVIGTITGNLRTEGDRSNAATIQSVGGGGGNGAFNVSGTLSGAGTGAGAVSVGVGGSGGKAGVGNTVTAKLIGNSTTEGEDSDGFLAQSLGGGGGNGAFNVSGALSGAGTGAGAVSVGVGGAGGDGGSGGNVTAGVVGDITTNKRGSDGFVAQSLGGGGGNGGFNVAAILTGAGTGAGGVSVGVGGSGGGGGEGKLVNADTQGTIITKGADAAGFLAQSVGGGGGNGGFNVSGALTAGGTGAVGASVGIGGSGGGGGKGGEVQADHIGNITTQGDRAKAFVAQSIGGGGGNGGFNVSGTLSAAGKGAASISVGVGGSGGDGKDGGKVTAKIKGDTGSDAEIKTEGVDSDGVFVQSVGGGGGNGGFNVTVNVAASGTGAGTIGVGVGGSGGGGGKGGQAELDLTGNVSVEGKDADGVIVQSVGGGGGNGGFNVTGNLSAAGKGSGNVGVGVGGFGGAGGLGGRAISTIKGDITTANHNSNGLLVQSVGGGGGNGGFNVTAGLAASAKGAGNLGVGVGGFGGGGGNAGNVTSNSTGDITTQKAGSYGALAQSLGGSGGNGGFNVTGVVSLSKQSGSLGIGVGGFGGGGGNSAKVDGKVDGQVSTSGAGSFGVMAQSVGGGGGNGGVNVSGTLTLGTSNSAAGSIGIGGFGGTGGNAGDVDFSRSGNTKTTGILSDGVTFQSLGGGGGNGAVNVSGGIAATASGTSATLTVGVGGFGGTGGTAGNVKGRVTGDVIATGEVVGLAGTLAALEPLLAPLGSNGIVAQSVGGGGGNGGVNVSGGISVGSPSGGGNYGLTLGIGGFGGAGGDAGEVDLKVVSKRVETNGVVTSQGRIVANGVGKSAVIAQSLGGGGGNGGLNVSGGITMDGSVTAGVGGSGGAAGEGKKVLANVEGDITATGVRSRGFVAQSIGGGGGDGAINISGGILASTQSKNPSLVFGLGGAGGAANVSGIVDATQKGTVDVSGVESIGVLAQSVAGGGGAGGLNVSGNLAAGKGYTAVLGIGGKGGTGADSKKVTLNSDGAITVNGKRESDGSLESSPLTSPETSFKDRANGVLVQSIGGGGGVGGMNVSGAFTKDGKPISAGVGGSGGAGGNAGEVVVNRGLIEQAKLETIGGGANGLTAQSVGGGGGDAGVNIVLSASKANEGEGQSVVIAVGGSGGASGDGSKVTVTQKGEIVTTGEQSDGLLAQSIGGGGGNANYNIGGGFNKDAKAFNLAVGGGTGDGGTGDDVVVDHTGNITTSGEGSSAIIAQSVGGGGGSTKLSMVLNLSTSKSLDIGIGRKGGTGGSAGNVTVDANGIFTTVGDSASAIIAQSVGNGGGLSSATTVGVSSSSGEGESAKASGAQLAVGLEGGSGGFSGDVKVTAGGTISTSGSESHGIHAQSVGGGGGVGGAVTSIIFQESASAKVGIGGDGGTGAKSGKVDVISSAAITTNEEKSHGISAQSIGGAGGTGGYAATVALQAGGASANGSSSATVSVGGNGGSGAEAEAVKVDSTGNITTKKDDSIGINAQSLGGGGGDGGLVIIGSVAGGQNSNSFDLGVGGTGGSGGFSRAVTVDNTAAINTTGKGSHGIRAQSIGGGGGNGGLLANIAISKPAGGKSANKLSINIGGNGGTGGTSGDVTVNNKTGSSIMTNGKDAHGIFAQSIGGGGGNGSAVLTLNVAGGKDSLLAGLNIGGKGGSGSTAGKVSVTNNGAILTKGEGSHGVFAQSIGGGGGNGGLVMSINAILAKGGDATTPLLSVGGFGGSGEDAGDVKVVNTGTIRTEGKNSYGILAQSIGGGGGNAGLGLGIGTSDPVPTLIANTLSAALGAVGGGTGGLAGNVTVEHSGDITVVGEGSQAIKAQSINGGGGGLVMDLNGITAIPGGSALPVVGPLIPTTTAPILQIISGAEGTTNNSAGAVSVTSTGTFGLTGDNNTGNSIQAIGGGGGTSLSAIKLAQTAGEASAPLAIKSKLGGSNGSGNEGAAITGGHTGDVAAQGANTQGVLLQSIGGGGGRSTIKVDTDDGELGAVELGLGGSNGSGESGKSVTQTVKGNIGIQGAQGLGILAQSIGGGGGQQTFGTSTPTTVLFARALTAPSEFSSAAAQDTRQFSRTRVALLAPALPPIDITLGSNGGAANDGDAVNITKTGNTIMSGDNASAIVLQSIGGGGGVAMTETNGAPLNVFIGGQNGASGDGGPVKLTNTGIVATDGKRAHGIFMQSIGGGGGASFHDGDSDYVTETTSTANSGNGGDVTLVQDGAVVVTGDESFAIFAQSLGGGGGFVDGYDFIDTAGGAGTGGKVDIEITGMAIASGQMSTAVGAQSTGTSGDDITIELKSGGIIAGGVNGAGVVIEGGKDNSLTNYGSISTILEEAESEKSLITEDINGRAIWATDGDDVINNHDRVTGNVNLGDGTNKFSNLIDPARFNMGTEVNLGDAENELFNNGIISGGFTGTVDTVFTTALSGTFVQTSTGNLEADLDFVSGDTEVGKIDRIDATGSAALDGTVDLFIVNPGAAAPGYHETTFVETQLDMISQNLVLNAPISAVAMYDILYPSSTEAKLSYEIDFAPSGLNGNQSSFGEFVNELQLAGGSTQLNDLVAAIFVIETLDGLKVAYDSLSPEPYATNLTATTNSISDFGNSMMSCRQQSGEYRYVSEGNCIWVQAARLVQDYAGDDENFAARETSSRAAGGIQSAITDNLFFGIAASFEDTNGRSGLNSQNDGERRQAGAVLKYRYNATTFAASLSGGYGEFDTSRVVNIGNVGGVAEAEQEITFGSAHLRVSHIFETGDTYILPALDLGATYIHQEGFTETGGGLANLSVDDRDETYFSIAPSLEFGGEVRFGKSVIRPKVKIGALHYFGGDDPSVAATLVGTPDGVSSFVTKAGRDDTLFTMDAGVDWIASNNVNLRFAIGTQLGEETENVQGSVKLTIPF